MYLFLSLELAKLSCFRVAMYIFLGLELAVLSFLVPYLPTSAFLYCVFKKKKMFCVNGTLSDIFHLGCFIH